MNKNINELISKYEQRVKNWRIPEKIGQHLSTLTNICEHVGGKMANFRKLEFVAAQKCANRLDLNECCKMRKYF